jgi:5-methyltetrahydrofolate--homocysteine methyltransferase
VKELPSPPDWDRHVLRQVNLDEAWSFLNPSMLYGKHLGLKGSVSQKLASGDPKAVKLQELVEALKEECRDGLMQSDAVFQFFPACRSGETILLTNPESGAKLQEFVFPRSARGHCLADYVSGVSDGDSVCMFAVTAGTGIRKVYQHYKDRGEFLKSHTIQALAVETAEGLAEWLHARIRGLWGLADPPGLERKDYFQARYRGKRYSFGYPACPDLSNQEKLWQLLQPEEIGIVLTEEHMMEPEASVSALVFHHPEAVYFSAG